MPLPKLNARQRYENEDRARMGGAASRGQVGKRANKEKTNVIRRDIGGR
jgi:hypothetical protein